MRQTLTKKAANPYIQAMRIDVHTADDIGARKEQQDSLGFTTLDDEAGSTLIVLADGVGGQTGGAVASRLVVDCFLEAAREGAFNDPAKQREALREALFEANRRLAERMTAEPQLEGMATTLVAAIVSPEAVRWVSVGDSHLYLLRGGALRKLNEDHSYAAMLVKAGTYRADDPELDQYRSVITSAVSGEEIKHVDLPEAATPLQPGDIVLAASDGLDTLPENHVEALLYEKRDGSAQDLAGALLTAVKRAGNPSQDNVSVVVARVAGKAETTASLPPVHDATTQRQ
ncbi:MAG: serine/threonine-protein phosphatase, partial [Alphaproteobacteria bacterium]